MISAFANRDEEASWVADEIRKNLANDELEHDDVLVIIAEPIQARSYSAAVMQALHRFGIDSHLAGVTTSRDALFFENSIAITSIHRAKGNEAPIVYILGAESCYRGWDLSRKRNILFTAMTRSRAWVRVCGVGREMTLLKDEMAKAILHNFCLDFKYPTADEIRKRTRIHRDRSEDEKAAIARDVEGVERLVRLVEDGEISPDTLPDKIQSIIRASVRH
jgi:superfamily I DNA and RNA helicase